MIEPPIERKLTLDRQGGMVHIRDASGRCRACIEAAAFEYVRQALMEEFLAAARKVAGGTTGRSQEGRNDRLD